MEGSFGFLVETTLRSLVVVLTADVVDEDAAGFAVAVVVVVASLLLFVEVDAVVSAPVEMAEDSRLLLSFSSADVAKVLILLLLLLDSAATARGCG